MMTRFLVVFGSPHQLKTEEKRLSKLVPSEKKLSGSAHVLCVKRGPGCSHTDDLALV